MENQHQEIERKLNRMRTMIRRLALTIDKLEDDFKKVARTTQDTSHQRVPESPIEIECWEDDDEPPFPLQPSGSSIKHPYCPACYGKCHDH